MKNFKNTNIIAGCINIISAVGIALALTFWYLCNTLPEKALGSWPVFVGNMIYIMAYLCSFFFALSFTYFVVMLVYSFIIALLNKKGNGNDVCEGKETKQ